jgi:hypothetical protein
MTVTLETLKQYRKFTKEEAFLFITYSDVLLPETSAYLLGYDYIQSNLSQKEIEDILTVRKRKYDKEVKFSKKKKLPLPEMYSTDVDTTKIILNAGEHARDHKDNFFPKVEGLTYLLSLFEKNKDTLIENLILEYKNKNLNYELFFSKWKNVLNNFKELKNLYSINKWFIIILEDKLTLGASFNGKTPYDLSVYKADFLS